MRFSERPIGRLDLESRFCATYPLVEVGFQAFPLGAFSGYLGLGSVQRNTPADFEDFKSLAPPEPPAKMKLLRLLYYAKIFATRYAPIA